MGENYGPNVISPLQWALDLYFKKKSKYKEPSPFDIILPAGHHKERYKKKGPHEIVITYTNREMFVRAKCTHRKDCEFNGERISGRDRDALFAIDWSESNNRMIFTGLRKLVVHLKLDFVTIIRALNTICDRKVKIPLTTQWGKTFEKFDDYRRNRWPEHATPDNKPVFIEEVLVRVCFWTMSADAVGALKK